MPSPILRGGLLGALVVSVAFALPACGGGGGEKSAASSGGSTTPGGIGTTGGTTHGGATTGATTGSTTGAVTQPGTNFAFVSSLGGGGVDVYDMGTGNRVNSVLYGGRPTDVDVSLPTSAGTPQAWVADLAAKTVTPYDAATYVPGLSVSLANAPLSQYAMLSALDFIFRVAYAPMGIAAHANGKLYIPAMISTTVVEPNGTLKGVMDLGLTNPNPSLFDLLMADVNSLGCFRAAASTSKVYVTNLLSSSVTVIDAVTDQVVANLPVGSGPAGVAVDANGYAWVACAFSAEVYKIDTQTDTIMAVIPVGVGPVDVVCDPAGNYVYVSNFLQGDVAKIDVALGYATPLPASSFLGMMNAMGLNPQMLQSMLTQILATMGGAASGGGTTTSGFTSFLLSLLGGTGAGSSGGVIGSMFTNLFNTMFAQLGGSAGNIPMIGPMGIGISAVGDRIAVSNAMLGDVSIVDVNTATVLFQQNPALMSGAMPFGGVTSVEVYTK